MKKFSITMISLMTMAGVALAQPKQADPKAGATASAGAKATAGGAGAAKGGAGATTQAGAEKAAPPAGAEKAGPPAQAPEMGKPPAEIKAMLKQMGARHTCTGMGLGPDMKSEVKFKGTTTNKLALDGWFIQGTMNATMGEGKTAFKMKMESYMTYDAKTGKWRSVSVMNDGTTMTGTSEMKDNKITGTATMTGPMGEGMFRETGDVSDPKAMKFTGEMSADKGKTWVKLYEMTCKK